MKFTKDQYISALQALFAGLGQLSPEDIDKNDDVGCAICEKQNHWAWQCAQNPLVAMESCQDRNEDPTDRFQPTATYDPDKDCIEFIAKPGPIFAKYVDDHTTAYYNQETWEVIGLFVSATRLITQILPDYPGWTKK